MKLFDYVKNKEKNGQQVMPERPPRPLTKIVLDCFGGDRGVAATVGGAVRALARFDDLFLILSGDEQIIAEELKKYPDIPPRYSILHAHEVISCEDKPTDAIRQKRDSSMMRGISLLREDDDVSGLVTLGSSGAILAAGTLRVGRLRGVLRPAFCPILPTMNGGIVGICDSGANIECKPDYFQQFAVMGSLYLQKVYGIETPRVALLNVGVEADKGDDLHRDAYALLSSTPGLNFVGNMEGRDLLSGKYDLVVCDGFSGNVLIKSTEGTAMELLKKLKVDIGERLLYKMGAGLMYKMFMQEKEFMNYHNYGGSVLLGTNRLIVKGHGSSNAVAVDKCIEQAFKMSTSQLNPAMESALCALPSAKL